MIRRYGRSLKGSRCVDYVPKNHWKNLTFIAGLRTSGITAPWCLDGAMNGDSFKTYLKTQLAPTLTKGDIVICDNLPAHKVLGVKEIIEEKGATILYLPPYSPDLNPIEKFFSKLKSFLRKIAERSYSKLEQTIAMALKLVTKDESENYFKCAGYEYN